MIISVLNGLLGLVVLVGIAWLVSAHRKKIDWPLVVKGISLQIIFAVLILKVGFIAAAFEWISKAFVKVISFTQFGNKFLFGSFETGSIDPALLNFAFNVLPTIIFFSAISSVLYYLGILQKVVYAFAWIMKRFMKVSGAESLSAAGNIFLGQTEAPLLVRPYIERMTRSEIMCLMTGGMATIAGGVLAAYISFLGGDSIEAQVFFAKHLLTASVMSAPAAIVAAKILIPETESYDESMHVSKDRLGSNLLEAITNGTGDGLKLAVNVAAMLLVFTALVYFGNYILNQGIGEWTGLSDWVRANTEYDGFTFQFLMGYLFAPVALLMGVHPDDVISVGQLVGEKTVLNEFYAYVTLGDMKSNGTLLHEKSIIMASYILCGFSNFASIGIQIGGIGTLAPGKKGILSQLGFYALLGGSLACMFTACIIGMFY